MASIEDYWNESMKIGVESLDDHHRTLLRLLLETRDASVAQADREIVKGVLAALISYTKYHFLAEERFMLDNSYPRIQEQRDQHKWFVDKLNDTFLSLSDKDGHLLNDLYAFLKNWFVEHILKYDKAMGAWILESRRAR